MANLESAKILLVSPLPPRAGGMAVQSAMWVRLMRADGCRVHCLRSNTAEAVVAGWPRVLRRVVLGLLWPVYVLRVFFSLLRADVVVLVTSSYLTFHLRARPVLWLAARLRRPVVLVYKGGDAPNFLAAEGDRVLPAVRSAARVVVPSEFLREAFARYDIATVVLPNLIDTSRFAYRERSMTPIRGLITRSLEAIYNNAAAIRAWAVLRRRHPDAELWIAGRGPEEPTLRKLADVLCPGAVRFLGYMRHEQLADIYDQCTCLVNPTNIDNMPGSVLEGQTAGLPVVSTDVGGVPLVVTHEETGLLVPPDDPQAIADAVERLVANPELAVRLARRARESVMKYAWAEVGPRWHTLLDEVLGSRRS